METRVMKIMWTIAALSCSVTLVSAQQAPRRPQATKPVAPAPTPRPRAQATEPVLAPPSGLMPGVDWLLDPPGALIAPWEPLTPLPPLDPIEPMVAIAPMPFELAPLTPLPGQWSIEFPPEPLLPGQWPIEAPLAPVTPDAPPAPLAPMVPPTPMVWDLLPGQGPVTPRPPSADRALEAELRRLTSELERVERANQRALEAQDRAAQREAEAQMRGLLREIEAAQRNAQRAQEAQDRVLQRELEAQNRELLRENDRIAQQAIREAEMEHRQAAREAEQAIREAQIAARTDLFHDAPAYHWSSGDLRVTVPAGWAKQDVADSVWTRARALLNRGEWGQAVAAFRSIPQQYPNSAYAPEAAYYQAFGLFRIGGTSELREALSVLESSRTRYPNARSRAEAASLVTRIRGVLAQRGDAQAAAELRASASEQGVTCDREEQSVQAEAMNQLSRMEGSNINELITRVLARKDECAIPLRKTAVFLVGSRRDAQAVSILSGVARSDPSVEVRAEAINIIGRLPNEEGVTVLEELVRSDDERIQRTAIRALVRHSSARARASVRSLVERDDVSERVRSEALSAFNSEQATADDIAWLRALYGKVTTPSLKSRTLSAIVRVGGPEVDQWLVTLASDDNQPSDIRATAMRRIGQTMSVADIGRLYDGATNRRFRAEIISVLGKRKEDAATDKLIDIIKNGTDPSLRSSAIQAVVSKQDARAQQLLLEIINK
ncbi:MAG TPA: HEAT repeat domain-containing protein [Gemmatimonadaceae bacterium]